MKKERERAHREITDLIRNTQSSLQADVKELQFKLNEYEDKTHNEIDLNGRSIRRSEGKSFLGIELLQYFRRYLIF